MLGLDAWLEPLEPTGLLDDAVVRRVGERVPMLFLRSAAWEGGVNDAYLLPFVSALTGRSGVGEAGAAPRASGAVPEATGAAGDAAPPADPILFQVDGVTHEQFSTLYMYRPVVRWIGLLGTVDPVGFARLQREIAARFVAHHQIGWVGRSPLVSPVPLGEPVR